MDLRSHYRSRSYPHDLWNRRSDDCAALAFSRSFRASDLNRFRSHAARRGMNAVAETIAAAGGLGGLAATITGIATLFAARRTASQLEPDHGTSVKDQLNRIERSLDEHGVQLDNQSSQLLQITRRVDSVTDHAHDAHSEIYRRLAKLEK